MKSSFATLAALTLMVFALSACGKHEKNNFAYMPDMAWSPAYVAQKKPMLLPVKGTVPRDYEPFHYTKDPKDAEAAGRELKNPLRPTREVLLRGQGMFNTYCITCHGPNGMGDGLIVPKFPRPPSLQSDKVRGWPDGRIYYTVTLGQNLMPSYASQIPPADRWAIIHYVRVLQRSQHPTAEDLKIAADQAKQAGQ